MKTTDSIEISWAPDRMISIVVHAETCEHCGERVRYFNTGNVGNAACGCTTEGPETCDPVLYRPVYLELAEEAIREMTRPSVDALRAMAKALIERADREEKSK